MSLALIEARKLALEEMDALAKRAQETKLSDDEAKRFDELEADIADLDRRMALHLKAEELRKSQPESPVQGGEIRNVALAPTSPDGASAPAEVREVSPYGKDSSESWFADLRTTRDRYASDAEVRDAKDRLAKHYAAQRDEGAVREVRALSTTTDSEGGYLVAPTYMQDEFIRLMVAGATTTSLVTKRPIPPKTDSINLPTMDGATAVALHTQNNALTETSATFNTVRCDVLRYGGAQTIPNFLLERSLPGVDQIVLADLARQLAYKLNTDIVSGSGTGTTAIEGILNADGIGTATATAGTATWSDVYPAIVNAIFDVAGSHYAGVQDLSIVMAPRRWAWILSQVDGDKRPLVGVHAPMNAIGSLANVNGPEGGAGNVLPVGQIQGVPVYIDASMPLTNGSGTDEDRIIVGAFREAYLFQAPAQFGVSTEAQFLKDQTLVKVTQDVAFTAERYPGAFSVVSGTALNDTV